MVRGACVSASVLVVSASASCPDTCIASTLSLNVDAQHPFSQVEHLVLPNALAEAPVPSPLPSPATAAATSAPAPVVPPLQPAVPKNYTQRLVQLVSVVEESAINSLRRANNDLPLAFVLELRRLIPNPSVLLPLIVEYDPCPPSPTTIVCITRASTLTRVIVQQLLPSQGIACWRARRAALVPTPQEQRRFRIRCCTFARTHVRTLHMRLAALNSNPELIPDVFDL